MTLYGFKTKFGQIDMSTCLCCRCAANVLQFCCKLWTYLFLHHTIVFSNFCFAAIQNFIFPKQKIFVTCDFIPRHPKSVLNSRKYQKIRYLTYFLVISLKYHGVHECFRVFFYRFKNILNVYESRGNIDVRVQVEEKE